jgi:hypothetical protein
LRNPSEGRARWTLELLADAMIKLTEHESLSSETVRRRLGENGLKPWRKDILLKLSLLSLSAKECVEQKEQRCEHPIFDNVPGRPRSLHNDLHLWTTGNTKGVATPLAALLQFAVFMRDGMAPQNDAEPTSNFIQNNCRQ